MSTNGPHAQLDDYPVERGAGDGCVFSSSSEQRENVTMGEPVEEPRPNTPEQQVSPEHERRADDGPPTVSNHEPALVEEPIECIVARVVIPEDAPMENLPVLEPPELKIIGRCVTFQGTFKVDDVERTMYYEGLVATISRDTLMLMHVHRYTEEDFEQYRNNYGKDNSESFQPAKQHGVAAVTEMPGETVDQTLVNMGGAYSNDMGDGAELPASGKKARGDDDHGEVTTRVRNKLKGRTGTLGPIPFMTFARSRIHNVQFGRDPRSNFYSLFQDPSKALMDMQYLRMFSRRYIVHTSQGNNPRQVPLRAFVTVRCACPDLDNDLLNTVTLEEVAHMVKAERSIRRGKRSKERQRRALISTYRAPDGLFRSTGLMYLTKIPLIMFIMGLVGFAMTAVFVIYAAVSITMAEPYVVSPYMRQFTSYIVAACVIWLFSVVLTVYHSVRISLPVKAHRNMIMFRFLLLLGAIACGLMIMIKMGRSFTVSESRKFLVRNKDNIFLSYYYHERQCSGYVSSCPDAPESPLCGISGDTYTTACHDQLLAAFERACLPLVIVACIILLVSVIHIYLIYKFIAVGHLIERRISGAGEVVEA